MNNLLLLGALAAGYVYFTKPKTTTKKTTTTPKTETPPKNGKLVAGSKEIGYEIYDCNKLIIYNSQKAYDYAFELGLETEELNGQFDDILFGKCFENAKDDLSKVKQVFNSLEKAKFAFNLFRYAFSGYIANTPAWKDEIIDNLKLIKSKFVDYLGFNSNDFDVNLIVKDLPKNKGFIITNCDKFTVTDPVKMKSYMDEAMISLFNSSNYKEKDGEAPYAPFDFAVQFLKQISPECYDRLVSEKISKDNFIISYMFIVASFLAYISFRFLMKDGVFIPDNWKETFGSLEEWSAYMTAANEILANWVNPLYVQFGLDNQKMTDLITQIGQVGKYPLN
jgi:hypothetical protein